MSVLLYAHQENGKFAKPVLELASYAYALAKQVGGSVTAIVVGDLRESDLQGLGQYGVSKVIVMPEPSGPAFDNQAYAALLSSAAKDCGATCVLLSDSSLSRAVGPRMSVRLKAGYVTGVVGLPVQTNPFTVKRSVFTGKAVTFAEVVTPVKVLILARNTWQIAQNKVDCTIEKLTPSIALPTAEFKVVQVEEQTSAIRLQDAEIVVSGGRGMRNAENWPVLEDLAAALGAALACSRPVADEGWRPHQEHVGQTGKVIAPNLYFACGISGAIQHIAKKCNRIIENNK